MAVHEPVGIPVIMNLVVWKPIKGPLIKGEWDICLNKADAKLALDRKTLRECAGFLLNAPDSWLIEAFAPKLSDEWRSAMGSDGTVKGWRYLAARLGADVMRASGLNP